VHEAVLVEEGAIEPERRPGLAAQLVFTDERPLERTSAGLNELIERGSHGGFMPGADVGELRQSEIVAAHGPVRRLKVKKHGHIKCRQHSAASRTAQVQAFL